MELEQSSISKRSAEHSIHPVSIRTSLPIGPRQLAVPCDPLLKLIILPSHMSQSLGLRILHSLRQSLAEYLLNPFKGPRSQYDARSRPSILYLVQGWETDVHSRESMASSVPRLLQMLNRFSTRFVSSHVHKQAM